VPREINLDELPYDPADQKRIREYTKNPRKQDEIRRMYLTRGPYRPPPGFKYPQKLIQMHHGDLIQNGLMSMVDG
jgi:hypothetical protein